MFPDQNLKSALIKVESDQKNLNSDKKGTRRKMKNQKRARRKCFIDLDFLSGSVVGKALK